MNRIRMTGGYEYFEEVKKQMYDFKKKQSKSQYRPLLLVLGGGQVGVYSAGGVAALEKLGLNHAFKYAVGISTGAPVISYLLSKQARVGSTIYYEENTGLEFINFSKLYSSSYINKYILDVEWLCKVFSGEVFNKKLNIEKFKDNNTEAYYMVTDVKTFKPEMINAKKLANPVEGIHASCAVPTLYNEEVKIKNKKYIDGDTSAQFPITMIMKKLKPTSILVFANRTNFAHQNILSQYFIDYLMKRNFATQVKSIEEERLYLENSGIPYTIIWSDNLVTNGLETNSKRLKLAAMHFYKFIIKNFKI